MFISVCLVILFLTQYVQNFLCIYFTTYFFFYYVIGLYSYCSIYLTFFFSTKGHTLVFLTGIRQTPHHIPGFSKHCTTTATPHPWHFFFFFLRQGLATWVRLVFYFCFGHPGSWAYRCLSYAGYSIFNCQNIH